MNDAFITPELEQRVRDRAYALWESEGRPAGRDAEHWRLSLTATLSELAAEMKQADMPREAKPKKAPGKKTAGKRAAA